VFGLPEMAERLASTGGIVPEFVNPKWADADKNAFKSPTRLECMMQDFPRLLTEKDNVGFTQLDRNMCFTCVKNNLADAAKKKPPDCALSAEADIYACEAELLRLAGQGNVEIEDGEEVSFLGVSAKIGARIILDPSFGISLEDMKSRIKGKVKISKRSSLVLAGDITLDGVDIDGSLKVTGNGVLKDKIVKNAGCPLEAIPEAELAGSAPSLQIRGYRRAQGECDEIQL